MKKKLSCLVLAFLLALQSLPMAQAAEGRPIVYVTSPAQANGDGTESRPYNNMEAALAAVADGGVISLLGNSIFNATDTVSITFSLPQKNLTICGNGNQLSFWGGIIMNGNLTLDGVTLYFSGPSKDGIDRRIYANGHDLTITNCAIGNRNSGYIDDNRGMVVLAGGLKNDVHLNGRTQQISINSGRLSGLYIGGESGGTSAGKLVGDVRVTLSGQALECAPATAFPLAGVFANGLNSGTTLTTPTHGPALEGTLDLSVSSMISGFGKYKGNGSSSISFADYGLGWMAPVFSDFSDLTLTRTTLKTSGAGLKNITLNDGGALWLTESGTFTALQGNGGTLQLTENNPVTFTGEVSGTTALTLYGNPPAANVSVPYVYGTKSSAGTLTGATVTETETQKVWSLTGASNDLVGWRMLVQYNDKDQPEGIHVLVLPEGKIPSDPEVEFLVQGLTAGGKPAPISGSITLSAPYDSCVELQSTSTLIPAELMIRDNPNLIPAGDMVVTGRAVLNDVSYYAQRIIRFVVAPSLDFTVTQEPGVNYLRSTLKGSKDFDGVVGITGDFTASWKISSGTSVQIPLTGLAEGEHELTVTFTPTDTEHFRSAVTTKTVTVTAELPPDPIVRKTPAGTPTYTEITAAGKTLNDARLSCLFTDPDNAQAIPGILNWTDGEGFHLVDTTPVVQGSTYHWLFVPADLAHYTTRTGSAVLWQKNTTPPPTPDGGGDGDGGGGAGGGSGGGGAPAPTPTPTPSAVPTLFSDVDGNAWYKKAVDFVSARKLFSGTGDGSTFAPLTEMTRGMLLTVLYRHEGASVRSGGSEWYADARRWAMDAKLSDGTGMDASITREQLATILYRYAGSPAAEGDLAAFPDAAQISGYALPAMRWAVAEGLLTGNGDHALAPQGNATRAEVAAILMRFIQGAEK